MRIFFKFLLSLILFIILGLVIAWPKRNELIKPILEKWVNQTQGDFFNRTLRIDGFNLKNDLRVSISSVRGTWQTEKGGFPFEVKDVELLDPVTHFILQKPEHITFKQIRSQDSNHVGLEGKMTLWNDKAQSFELETTVIELYLEELTALNPEVLKGSSGKLTGGFYLKTKKSGEQKMRLNLKVVPPGGRIQAHFFDVLLPYLPAADKAALVRIRQMQTVGYKEGDIRAELGGKDSLKIFLNMKVPEYNLNLNLNLTIRVEDNEAFFRLAELMGLVKVESV